MYGTVNGNNATTQNLIQQFHVHELTANMQAADCVIHMQQVAAFCALPLVYPTRQKMECQRQCTLQTHHPGYSGWCHT
jgi:hypothetical protein